jgi:hypothetical protein
MRLLVVDEHVMGIDEIIRTEFVEHGGVACDHSPIAPILKSFDILDYIVIWHAVEPVALVSGSGPQSKRSGSFFRQIRREGPGDLLQQIKRLYCSKCGGQKKATESRCRDDFLAADNGPITRIVMATSESYWAYARECEHWARKVADETDRRVFFEIASAWKELAMREKLRAAIDNNGLRGRNPGRSKNHAGSGGELTGSDGSYIEGQNLSEHFALPKRR